jgi:hypothetical protein
MAGQIQQRVCFKGEFMHPRRQPAWLRAGFYLLSFLALLAVAPFSKAQGLTSGDLSRFRFVGDAVLSPDGHRIAYTVILYDHPGRPSPQLWIMDLAAQKPIRFGGEKDVTGNPRWSPDGKWLAFQGRVGEKHGLLLARPDGSEITTLVDKIESTNSPLPGGGQDVTWSPDGKQIAFISSTPDERAAEARGDPMVISRYLYKPDAGEGMTRFNDNQRLHIFVVDLATKQVRQLTEGIYDEHSIDWSPDGKEILFLSNREPNQDEFFNYDIFALRVADGSIRRLTATEYNEYEPLWSPDGKHIVYRGTKRGLTDRETTMEDTHVWMMNADGSDRREIGAVIDNRQGAPKWAPDGSAVYFTVQERGIYGERYRWRWRFFRRQGRHAGLRVHFSARYVAALRQERQRGAQAHGLERGSTRCKTNRGGGVLYLREQRQQIRSRSISHQARGNDRHLEASAYREHSWRPARAEWPGVQL